VKDDNWYSYTNAPATSEVFGRDRIQAIATYLPETYIMRQLSENDSDQPHKFRVEITYKQ
jgi:hypothetical protein